MGLLLMKWLPNWNIQPGVYAMCAAAAMLGGVFRSSISLVVIVVEGTQVWATHRVLHIQNSRVNHPFIKHVQMKKVA